MGKKRKKFDPRSFAALLARTLRQEHPDIKPSRRALELIKEIVEQREPTEYWKKRLVPMVWDALFPDTEMPAEFHIQTLF